MGIMPVQNLTVDGQKQSKQAVDGWTSTFVSGGKPPQLTQCHACTALCAELFKIPPGLTFSNSTFCPHSAINVFCVDLRTNSDYFPTQH